MTDEVPPQESVALTKAQRLEAKAARLREQEAAKAAAGPAAPLSTRALIPWAIAVAVLVLALVGSVLYGVHESNRADNANHAASTAKDAAATAKKQDTLEASALTTARTVATSFGTYDYQTLTADFARTRSYLTPSFAADFSKISSTLGSLITQAKGQTVGTVQDVGIESISNTSAVVIVFLDQKVTSADSTTPRIDHNRLRLTLAMQPDGHWLVSKLELI